MKNLYIKNCKALMNKIEDYTKKWKKKSFLKIWKN